MRTRRSRQSSSPHRPILIWFLFSDCDGDYFKIPHYVGESDLKRTMADLAYRVAQDHRFTIHTIDFDDFTHPIGRLKGKYVSVNDRGEYEMVVPITVMANDTVFKSLFIAASAKREAIRHAVERYE